MALLLVISNFDLTRFGCPHCNSREGGALIVSGSCTLWVCAHCGESTLVVGNSIKEVQQFTLRNTEIKNLIGKHPYQYTDTIFQINTFAVKLNTVPIC